MRFACALMVILLAVSLGVSGCATGTYPAPRPGELPPGIDEGLMYPGWDGGYPLRWVAYLLYPFGVAADLIINQPLYALGSAVPDLFGYTAQDENYRQDSLKYRYHWPSR